MPEELYNDDRGKKLAHYGWSCSEDNLATLPLSAPTGAQNLAQWLTLEGRRSSLVEWIGQTREDGRIHGTVRGIGAWTQRCSHNSPNTANISAVFKDEVRSSVDQVKLDYNERMRDCWTVEDGKLLVGTDAEGIQLRILADWLWKHFGNTDYAKAIHEGDKKLETDIHNVNKRALGLNHISRDNAKTFIYAYVLNAGDDKVASILDCSKPVAKSSKDRFERSIVGLSDLKTKLIPFIARQGHFTGYDGRLVKVPNAHKVLAGILQAGEAVVMKHAMIEWRTELKKLQIENKCVGFVHDEWITEANNMEEAEKIGEVQRNAIVNAGVNLGFLCPLAASTGIGTTWAQIH